ncbi:MAG: YdaS family helix-turn-helix protein [Nitrospirota bacterium]|nr:YdaS family helix-turn-helix protein [Nitrospirota bacterium]
MPSLYHFDTTPSTSKNLLTNEYLFGILPSMELIAYLRKKSATQLASEIGTSPMYLFHIASKRRKASPKMAVAIQRATGGEVSVYDLRPDLADIFNLSSPSPEQHEKDFQEVP